MTNRDTAVRIQARTLEDALAKASQHLGVKREQLNYEVTKTGGGGLLAFLTGRRIEIAAWVKPQETRPTRRSRGERQNEERRPRTERARSSRVSADETPLEPARELSAEEVANLVEDLREFTANLCGQLSGEPVEVTAKVDDGRLILNVDSEYVASQLLRNAKLAEAFEHVLRKKPRHLRQELPFRIFFDARHVRSGRERELVQMAKDLSDKVAASKRPIVLNYKNSYDRKVIHMALEKDTRVYTKSIGSGSSRTLMILPSQGEAAADETAFEPTEVGL